MSVLSSADDLIKARGCRPRCWAVVQTALAIQARSTHPLRLHLITRKVQRLGCLWALYSCYVRPKSDALNRAAGLAERAAASHAVDKTRGTAILTP